MTYFALLARMQTPVIELLLLCVSTGSVPSLSLTTSQDRRIAATQELSSLFEKRDNIMGSSVPSLPKAAGACNLHFTEPWAISGSRYRSKKLWATTDDIVH